MGPNDAPRNWLQYVLETFPDTVFVRGELFKVLTFWGMAEVRYLFLIKFSIEVSK